MMESMSAYHPYDEGGERERIFGKTPKQWDRMTIEERVRVMVDYGENKANSDTIRSCML